MKKTINRADAARLAQARELIKAQTKDVNPPLDSEGRIVPSRETVDEINEEYEINVKYVIRVEQPPQHRDTA